MSARGCWANGSRPFEARASQLTTEEAANGVRPRRGQKAKVPQGGHTGNSKPIEGSAHFDRSLTQRPDRSATLRRGRERT
jgi:hypothetical protein